ncbi:hypothetical protein [Alkalibaculum sporogenes]|uniref:hypothetical protein n=1 Tax=Alkalibaculum sporogenes TaxID=2655001 RepID=UPI00187B52DD|nr:hypothetical protein [Alkalibaculum sporogenes]
MNNGEAIGYMILAAKALGLDEKAIKNLEREMNNQMDMRSESYAYTAYCNF